MTEISLHAHVVIPPSPSSFPPGTKLVNVATVDGNDYQFVNPDTYRLLSSVPLIRVGSASAYQDFSPTTIISISTVITP